MPIILNNMHKNLSKIVTFLLVTSTALVNAAPAAYATAPSDPGPKPKYSIDMQGLVLKGAYQNVGGQPTGAAAF